MDVKFIDIAPALQAWMINNQENLIYDRKEDYADLT